MYTFFFNMMKTLALWFYTIKKYFAPRDNEIDTVFMEYDLVRSPCRLYGKFWVSEMYYLWNSRQAQYAADVTKLYKRGLLKTRVLSKIPTCVNDVKFRVKYYYNNHVYKILVDDVDTMWPPKEENSMSLAFPIKVAHLLDKDDTFIADVTKKVKRYAGPKNNFYNMTLKLSDFIWTDFEKLRIVNILNQECVVTDEITGPLSWSLNKI